jgi:hypothetical protein
MIRTVIVVVCAMLLLAIAICEAGRRAEPNGRRRLELPKGGPRA